MAGSQDPAAPGAPVPGSLAAFGAAFALVFVAEFADKTQLALVALSARGRPVRVFLGATAAFLLLSIAAVAVGGLVGSLLPTRLVAAASGILFILFGVLALRGAEGTDGTSQARAAGFWPAFTLMLVAELGDKTQIALAALAAAGQPAVATALGGWLALSCAAALAVALGGVLQNRVPGRVVSRVAGVLFLAAGAFFIVGAVFGWA